MTKDEKKAQRDVSAMKLFNFYLDEPTKREVLQKLEDTGFDTKKGTLSALIRALLNFFVELNRDDETYTKIIIDTYEEYLYTTTKNKRSSL